MPLKPDPKSARPIAQNQASFNVAPARKEAFKILLELEEQGTGQQEKHSDDLLRSPSVNALSPQDRNLTTTMVMGTLRWQIRLDNLIRKHLSRPDARLEPAIQTTLRLGAFQLLFMDRIPAHAAIGEAVALAKTSGHQFAAGMVNAVLRKLTTQPKPAQNLPSNATAKELAEVTAHPQWLVDRWVKNYGILKAATICHHGQQQPELSLRIEDSVSADDLATHGIHLSAGAILSAARRLTSGDIFTSEAFRTNKLRIQDEGSQLIAELAASAILHPETILDACAAPGGKTLILAELNPHAKITACEISPARARALKTRISESPYASQCEVIQADVTRLAADAAYDLVLVDVPCSGTGTLGRNPEIRHRLQPADLSRHHDRQCAILEAALTAGKTRVLYSTCSLEPEENAAVVAKILAANPAWRQASIADVIDSLSKADRLAPEIPNALQASVASDGSLTLLPGSLGPEIQTDGFYAAVLERITQSAT